MDTEDDTLEDDPLQSQDLHRSSDDDDAPIASIIIKQENVNNTLSDLNNDATTKNYEDKELLAEKKYACRFCEFSSNKKYNLINHERTHTDEKPFTCSYCCKQFKLNRFLRRHILKMHTAEKPYVCINCGKKFTNHSDLSRHLTTHGEKEFTCDYCKKKFLEKSHLKRHLGTHTGEKPFTCGDCGKSFLQKSALKNHLLIHTRVKAKPFKRKRLFTCDYCGKSFNHKSALPKHIRIHTGEKPHACEYCGRKFAQKCHLKLHIMTHTGEKPFMCNYCGKQFTEKSTLTRHKIRIHTGEKSSTVNIDIKPVKIHTYREVKVEKGK